MTYPCGKQRVVAIYVVNGKVVGVGENTRLINIPCPRAGLASGEGYHYCTDTCGQEDHSEVKALRQSGWQQGGTMYLIGHTYACESCQKAMDSVGATLHIRKDA